MNAMRRSWRKGYVELLFISLMLVLTTAIGNNMNDESTELSSTSFESFAGAVRSRLSQRQQIHKSDLKSKRFRRSLRSSAINEVSSANTTYASFDIDGAILRAQKTANLIYQRFEFWHPKRYLFFLYSMNLPTWTWDILKYKLALKVLLPIGAQAKAGGAGSNANSRPSTAASSLSSNENKEFLYVFGGSSVTAGHDNWFNESYPMVFQRRLQPIYDALGVPLKVHNIAQGANNCFPADYCYGAMGGAAADWINWEQSFNCGKAANVYELMAREASWTDALLHFSASGGYSPKECQELPANQAQERLWAAESWTPETAGLSEGRPIPHAHNATKDYDGPHIYHEYTPNATTIRHLKRLLHEGYMEANPVGRFTGLMWPHYNGVGPHGYSVWSKGALGDAMNLKGPCYDQGGAHWMTKEASYYSRGHGASWHPSASMHLLRGELIVFNYLHAFLEAMYMLREDLGSEEGRVPTVLPVEKRNLLLAKYRTALKNLQVPMPAKALRCSPDCDTRPVCSTNFKPHYNKKSLLSERVVGAPHGWSYVMKMGSTLHMNGNVDWGYLDRRPCYESSGIVNATISFQIQIQNAEQSWIKICAYDHKEGLRHAHFYLHANQQPACSHCATAAAANGNPSKEELEMILSTAIDADGAEVAKTTAAAVEGTASHAPYVLPDLHTLKRLTSRKYHGDECHAVTGLPVGKHVLTVVTHSAEDTKAGKVAPNHVYSVSHIIEWE